MEVVAVPLGGEQVYDHGTVWVLRKNLVAHILAITHRDPPP